MTLLNTTSTVHEQLSETRSKIKKKNSGWFCQVYDFRC